MIISTIKCKNEIKTAKSDKNGIAKIRTIKLFNNGTFWKIKWS